jgi:hypothetical protein
VRRPADGPRVGGAEAEGYGEPGPHLGGAGRTRFSRPETTCAPQPHYLTAYVPPEQARLPDWSNPATLVKSSQIGQNWSNMLI